MADKLIKQPFEAHTLEVDFSGKLDADDSLIVGNSTVTALDSNGDDVSASIVEAGSLAVSGLSLFARVKGGTDGAKYKITFRTTSNKGEKVEHDIDLIIREK